MSLIHWWPLTETAKDIIGIGPDVNTPSYVVGKIGKALDGGWITGTAQQWNDWMSSGSISIAMWAKVDTTGSYSYGTPFFGNGGSGKRRFALFSFSGSSDELARRTALHYSWMHDELTGYNTYVGDTIEGFFEKDVWVHLCVTQDAAAGVVRIYKNGAMVKEHTGLQISNKTFTTDESAYFRPNYNYMKVNDLRLYNHALSKKEVKELSKALVLHYTFDNSSFESTTNLLSDKVTNFSNSPLGTYSGFENQMGTGSLIEVRDFQNKRYLYFRGGSGSNDRCYIYKDVAGSTKYTFSCDIYSTSQITLRAEGNGGGYGSGWPEVGRVVYSTPGKWQRVSYTMDVAASPRLYLFFVIPNGVECYINNLQLEEKDHATTYIPTSRTSCIGDGSGLGNDGILVLPEYYSFTQDSILGTGALYSAGNSDGTAYIKTNLNPSFIAGTGTICFWYKKNTGSDGFLVATPDPGNQKHYLWANSPGKDPWNDGGASYSHWYIDGVQGKTPVSDTDWHFYCIAGVNISGWTSFAIQRHGDGSWLYRGKIADFRVYNTVLDSDEIQTMYKARWAANKQGQVFSNAINEGQSTHQITRSGVEKCNELNEIPLPSGYQRIEYIQSAGSSYIDTGIAPGTALRFRTIVSDISSSAYVITQGNYGLRGYAGTFTNFVSGRRFKGSITITSGVRYVVTGNNDGIWINDVAGVQETDNDSPSGNVKLMASGNGKMYECMLWNGNTLVRAFVPVIAPNGTPCMYDYVTNRCYGSSTDTAFTSGGNIVSKVQYSKNGNIYCAEFNEI